MKIRKGTALVAILLAVTLSGVASGAGQRRNQQQQQQQRGQAAPQKVGPSAATKPESDAFEAVRTEADLAKKLALSDAFLSKFPDSQLTGYVHRFRMESLNRMGKFKDAIAAGEAGLAFEIKFMQDLINQADASGADTKDSKDNKKDKDKDKNAAQPLDKNSPEFQTFREETEKAMLYYYQSIMTAYQQLNDAAKTVEWAEKAHGQDPDDLLTLLTLSGVLAERPPSDEKQKDEQMKRVLDLGKKAEAKVAQVVSSPAGAQMSADQKAGLVSTVHQTLGLANLNLKKYSDAEKEYLAAIAAKKDDSVSYFRLGIAYVQNRRPDQAMDALAKSVFLKGIAEAQARDILKQLYEAKNKSSEGLEDFIKNAGQKIGQ
jgi:tetratricopeptide (TPR) repeat protein